MLCNTLDQKLEQYILYVEIHISCHAFVNYVIAFKRFYISSPNMSSSSSQNMSDHSKVCHPTIKTILECLFVYLEDISSWNLFLCCHSYAYKNSYQCDLKGSSVQFHESFWTVMLNMNNHWSRGYYTNSNIRQGPKLLHVPLPYKVMPWSKRVWIWYLYTCKIRLIETIRCNVRDKDVHIWPVKT